MSKIYLPQSAMLGFGSGRPLAVSSWYSTVQVSVVGVRQEGFTFFFLNLLRQIHRTEFCCVGNVITGAERQENTHAGFIWLQRTCLQRQIEHSEQLRCFWMRSRAVCAVLPECALRRKKSRLALCVLQNIIEITHSERWQLYELHRRARTRLNVGRGERGYKLTLLSAKKQMRCKSGGVLVLRSEEAISAGHRVQNHSTKVQKLFQDQQERKFCWNWSINHRSVLHLCVTLVFIHSHCLNPSPLSQQDILLVFHSDNPTVSLSLSFSPLSNPRGSFWLPVKSCDCFK